MKNNEDLKKWVKILESENLIPPVKHGIEIPGDSYKFVRLMLSLFSNNEKTLPEYDNNYLYMASSEELNRIKEKLKKFKIPFKEIKNKDDNEYNNISPYPGNLKIRNKDL